MKVNSLLYNYTLFDYLEIYKPKVIVTQLLKEV